MAAYVLAEIEITNPEGYKEYSKLVPDTIARFGGRFLVRGGDCEALEGEWPQPRRVLLEFRRPKPREGGGAHPNTRSPRPCARRRATAGFS